MVSLCEKCREIVDENPFAVLFRKDEFENYLLCHSCRKKIWSANKNAMQGVHEFTFKNPNATRRHSVQASDEFVRPTKFLKTEEGTKSVQVSAPSQKTVLDKTPAESTL
jgi:MinD superfamily P-loop ATPase